MTQLEDGSSGWREAILTHFTVEVSRIAPVTVVHDPDRLFSEQRLVARLQEQGFEVVGFDDPVAFRYLYESRFRMPKAATRSPQLVLTSFAGSQAIPFDILHSAAQLGRVLSFGLAELFPQLSPGVIAELDRNDLDALFRAQQLYQPGSLGENATRDFILRHVCEVAPELIRNPVDLLRVLLRRHYQCRQYPAGVDQRFIALVRTAGLYDEWSLESIVPDRSAFLTFLQERWERFVREQAGVDPQASPLTVSGPANLPFDHPDIRVYIDNLCIEGVLKPIQGVPRERLRDSWLAIGVVADDRQDVTDRFDKLTTHLCSQVPDSAASYFAWVSFAFRWAEWNLLRNQLPAGDAIARQAAVAAAQNGVDDAFERWLLGNYGALGSLSYLPQPVMVHQVGRAMAHGWSPAFAAKRKALIVVDGLAIDQWLILRTSLGSDLHVNEGGVFAWVPTLTSVSRQSIFAGEPPLFFSASLHTTSKEEHHWACFWENQGIRRDKIAYIKQKSQEDTRSFVSRMEQHIEATDCRVLGVVVGVVDDAIHGSAMGSGGLHAQVRYWAQSGYLQCMLDVLVARGFDVHLVADHGNVEVIGIGKPNVGVVAEQRGARALIVTDDAVRRSIHVTFPESVPWPALGIPTDFLPLIAHRRTAFIGQGETAVCHGGLAIEEVIVPYIRVARKQS